MGVVIMVSSRYYLDMKEAEKIAQLIERLGRLVASDYHADSFKPVQWQALLYLSQANVFSRNATALGEYLGITKGSLSQTLSTLEQRGLLRKRTDKKDKRLVHLELTAAGVRTLNDNPLLELSKSIGKLNAPRRQELATSLETILSERLNQNDRRPFGQCRNCRYLKKERDQYHCGLLNEPLEAAGTNLICAEFEAKE